LAFGILEEIGFQREGNGTIWGKKKDREGGMKKNSQERDLAGLLA